LRYKANGVSCVSLISYNVSQSCLSLNLEICAGLFLLYAEPFLIWDKTDHC
jgi:hypothetical protein